MGTKERKHNKSDDAALFRDAFADARPIKAPKRHVPEKPKPSRPRIRSQDKGPAADASFSQASHQAETDDEFSFRRNAVSRKLMRELRRGKLTVQAELDLHGYTRDAAHTELQDFIFECADRSLRCVRVVHGKGHGSGPEGPVLKGAVNGWLRHWQEVLAFCPARIQDGGTGALYVLLRSQ